MNDSSPISQSYRFTGSITVTLAPKDTFRIPIERIVGVMTPDSQFAPPQGAGSRGGSRSERFDHPILVGVRDVATDREGHDASGNSLRDLERSPSGPRGECRLLVQRYWIVDACRNSAIG